MYRYETHLHTREASACAGASGVEMAAAYGRAGYAGIMVTDHFFNGCSAVPRALPWAARVARFCAGYAAAQAAGAALGLQVFFGWEYGYFGTEFLTYGLDADFLLAYPEMLDWPLEEYFAMVHRHGGFLVHAHPFRRRDYIAEVRLYPDAVDAVEVFNAGNTPEENVLAAEYAAAHGLPATSGSDAHGSRPAYPGGIASASRLESLADYRALLQAGTGYTLLAG